MKIIKLDNRYKYFKFGFTHAFKFDKWDATSRQLESFMISQYGPEPCYHHQKMRHNWIGYYGKFGSNRFPYWICVKNEAAITMALLSIDHVKV
jgi:hypothetical protein